LSGAGSTARPGADRSDGSDVSDRSGGPESLSPTAAAATQRAVSSPRPSSSAASIAPAPPSVDAGVDAAIDNVQVALRDFRATLGGNPVGTNAEITAALLGDNPRQLRLTLPQGSTIDRSGQLTDPWGTPYFFHQLSGTRMEVRSAGPDRRMWTGDDAVR
jgi:hypothetical protein